MARYYFEKIDKKIKRTYIQDETGTYPETDEELASEIITRIREIFELKK